MQQGTTIVHGPADWQIYQQEAGKAEIHLSGNWKVPEAAGNIGIRYAKPVVRVVREEDGFPLVPWKPAQSIACENKLSGEWQITLVVPSGGLYRIETGLDTVSVQDGLCWMFRGDLRFHVGVGDVFLIAGQSNAAGYAADSAYDPPDLRIHLLRNRLTWELACHPMNDNTDAENSANADIRVNGASPYLSFARRFSDFSNRPVGLIQSAMSGQAISRWDTRENGDLFENMLNRVKYAGGKIAGVLWYQGCSDAFDENSAKEYGKAFLHIVNQTRRQLNYDIPFFTIQLNRISDQSGVDNYWGLVREAQRAAAKTIPGVYVIPSIDVSTSDHIHNSAHACLTLGERQANQCACVLLGKEKFAAPNIIDAKICDEKCVVLTFENTKGELLTTSTKQGDLGFDIDDLHGKVSILLAKAENNCLKLYLERKIEGRAYISFAWQANPTRVPPLDNVTYLPPLAFYKVEINFE